MYLLLSYVRPGISWLLLATLGLPLLPAQSVSGNRLAFHLATFGEPLPAALRQPGTLADESAPASTIHLVVVAGNNSINVLKKKIAVAPQVEVRDGVDRPVAGALVTFTAPGTGASVEFDQGTRTAMLVSGSDGRVLLAGITPINSGPFVYRVRALYREQEATATIPQTNVADSTSAANTTTGAGRHHGLPGWGYAALIGGAAAGIGAGVAMASKQSGRTTPTPTSATIGAPGTPTIGPGH